MTRPTMHAMTRRELKDMIAYYFASGFLAAAGVAFLVVGLWTRDIGLAVLPTIVFLGSSLGCWLQAPTLPSADSTEEAAK